MISATAGPYKDADIATPIIGAIGLNPQVLDQRSVCIAACHTYQTEGVVKRWVSRGTLASLDDALDHPFVTVFGPAQKSAPQIGPGAAASRCAG